jgi:hypothetical protein
LRCGFTLNSISWSKGSQHPHQLFHRNQLEMTPEQLGDRSGCFISTILAASVCVVYLWNCSIENCAAAGQNVCSGGAMAFKFNDSARLGDNLAVYAHELAELDATLGPILAARLDELVAGVDSAAVLDELLAALAKAPKAS